MAGWSEILEATPRSVPRQVFLCTGEISAMVWDLVHSSLSGYDFHLRVESETDLSFSLAGMGANSAYLLVDPTEKMLESVETLLRKGSTEAFFILISGEATKYPKPTFEYIKKKAQQHKSYYTLTAPKSQQARDKMISYFIMRWGVGRDTSQLVCSSLEYSPGRTYLFDKQFLLCTEGRVLPSTRTSGIVDELLGSDSPNMVVTRIASGVPLESDFGEDFTYKVLKFLHTMILHSRLIQGAWSAGESNLSSVSKFTGLTQFLVLRAWGMAENYDSKALRHCENLILSAMEHVQGNPDVLSVVSRAWRS